MTKTQARRIIELLYTHAWGNKGSFELRQEFKAIYTIFQKEFNIGKFLYSFENGASKHTWTEEK